MFKAPPEKYVAQRRVTLQGVTYVPGQQIPDEVVLVVRDIDALLSRGYISGDPDQHGRRTSPGTPRPTSTPATVKRALRERVEAVPPPPDPDPPSDPETPEEPPAVVSEQRETPAKSRRSRRTAE